MFRAKKEGVPPKRPTQVKSSAQTETDPTLAEPKRGLSQFGKAPGRPAASCKNLQSTHVQKNIAPPALTKRVLPLGAVGSKCAVNS